MNIDDRNVTKRKPKPAQFDANDADASASAADYRPAAAPTQRRRRAHVRSRRTMSMKANLLFPVARFKRYLRDDRYAAKVSPKSCVYLAAVLEYLTAEVLDIASEVATQHKKSRINPRHLTLAILNDMSLNRLVPNLTITEGGVLPNIQPFLIAKEAASAVKPKTAPTTSSPQQSKEDTVVEEDEEEQESEGGGNNINTNASNNADFNEPDWD